MWSWYPFFAVFLHEVILVSIADESETGAKLYSPLSQRSKCPDIRQRALLSLYQCNALTMVNRSDADCRFEETSFEGAAGSFATTTAPGAPGVSESPSTPNSLYRSTFDIMAALDFSARYGGRCLSSDKS